ncbi:MAG TPA: aminomethyl-transferring glycine dehydrogenase subunit GcvPA [Tepidisphaeraceae bacterium]|nr:aminomethyl-transferring glycine dehydrogenase subunit GcvPA [Tepidisphaeraceae bacterium]
MLSTEPVPSSTVKDESDSKLSELLAPSDTFVHRHVGPSDEEIGEMLKTIGVDSLDALVEQTVPKSIRIKRDLKIGKERAENELLAELKSIAQKNKVFTSLIGQGYHGTITPPVILRNILENPGWYTAYTPYQPEISQGRLEALLNFQTMVSDLTGLKISNASLLDEGTAAAEAMAMAHGIVGRDDAAFFVDEGVHPQTIAVVKTRARSLGFKVIVGKWKELDDSRLAGFFGVLVQYPTTDGNIENYQSLADRIHAKSGLLICAADILALTVITPPGEFGADIAIGSTQRFGVPMGFGGPHAGYMSCREEHVRRMPGRLIGVSKDAQGNNAYRLTLQTREQHIKRERATSNICTAQVLLAVIAGMYAAYHGPKGLARIANRIHLLTALLIVGVEKLGHKTLGNTPIFDTL